ncbi:MAG: DMT family transporter [Pseudomonadota bacterium]
MVALIVASAFAIGVLLALQPPINAAMAAELGNPFLAAIFSITISLVLVAFAWMSLGNVAAKWSAIIALPWWVVLGGAAGAFFVAGGILVAPQIGVALFIVCVIAGQLVGAAVADHFGAFGVAERALSWPRLIGIGLVLSGVALVQWSSHSS